MAAVPSSRSLSGLATLFSTEWPSEPQTLRFPSVTTPNRLRIAGKARIVASSSNVSQNKGRSEKPDDPVFVYNVPRRSSKEPPASSHGVAQSSETRVQNRVSTSNGAVQSESSDAPGSKGGQLRANTVAVAELETLLTRPPERLVPQVSENHKSGELEFRTRIQATTLQVSFASIRNAFSHPNSENATSCSPFRLHRTDRPAQRGQEHSAEQPDRSEVVHRHEEAADDTSPNPGTLFGSGLPGEMLLSALSECRSHEC